MSRDIQLKVMLSAEEYVAFRAMAEEEGQSQSGLARVLIKQAIRTFAVDAASEVAPEATAGTGQE